MTPDEAIREITRRLVEQFDPRRVILFGSRARGDAHERSDVDILVLLDAFDDWFGVTTAMHQSLRGVPLGCDIVLFTPEEYEIEKQIPGTAARFAEKEGRTLYERAA